MTENEGKKTMARWVRRNRRIYQHSLCKLCGTSYGVKQGKDRCEQSKCLACGSVQCSSNGLSRGLCKICFVGYLPEWYRKESRKICGYKDCEKEAVAVYSRVGQVCKEHLSRAKKGGITLEQYIRQRLLERELDWELVED